VQPLGLFPTSILPYAPASFHPLRVQCHDFLVEDIVTLNLPLIYSIPPRRNAAFRSSLFNYDLPTHGPILYFHFFL
jgi:hypothetical protein